jgi:hypothetical protein
MSILARAADREDRDDPTAASLAPGVELAGRVA